MNVTVGMVWMNIGKVSVEIPDEFKDASDEEIQDYVRQIWDDIPLPQDGSYITGSDEPDFDYAFEREE